MESRMDIYSSRTHTFWLPDAYYNALEMSAAMLKAPTLAFLLVIYAESGHHATAAFRDTRTTDVIDSNGQRTHKLWHPDPDNPALGYPSSIGLCQITPGRARAMGMSEPHRLALLEMVEMAQLPLVVRAYLATGYLEPYRSAGHLYLATYAPALLPVAGDPFHRVYARDIVESAFRWSAPLDLDDPAAYIEVGELTEWLARRGNEPEYEAHKERLDSVTARS